MKAQRSNSRNDALVEAAAERFAGQGFKATSMRDIAKAAGMLPGSIYYHFPSKDDLLLTIYESGVEQITAAFDAAIEPIDDPWDRLQAGVAALIRAVTEESAFTRVIFKVRPDEVSKYSGELVALRDAFEAKFAALVDGLPLRRGVDPRLLRLLILGAGNHAQLWFSPDGDYSADEVAEQFCRYVKEPVEK